MIGARWWAIAVIAVAVACGGGALASSQTPTVAYTGLSAQRLPITLSVGPDGETLSLDITWMASCGRVVRTIRPAVTTIAAGGEFAWVGTYVDDALGDGDEDRQRLRLVGRRDVDGTLSGVWHAERDHYNGQAHAIDGTCSSGDVAFRVSRGGSTSQPAAQRDRSGHLVIALEDEPDLVAAGAGRTWVHGQAALVRSDRAPATSVTAIDPRSGRAATPTRLDDIGYAGVKLAAGEGAAWLLKTEPPARLLRIDARTRRVVRGPRLSPRRPTGSLATRLAVGAGGVWVLSGDRVLRADPRNGRLVRSIRLPADPRFRTARKCTSEGYVGLIAIHRDAVWVMATNFLRCRSHASSREFALARKGPFYSLARIDPRTNGVTRTVALGQRYTALAAGRSGVWGVGCLQPPSPRGIGCDRPAVHRISLRNGRPTVVHALPTSALEPPTPDAQVTALAVGPSAIWIIQPADNQQPGSAQGANRPRPGVLRRIGLTTRQLSTVRAIPRLPADLAADKHGTWVVDGFDRTLVGIRR